ncbi:PRKR-interacting protein 1 [Callorhinus ursinus]
MNSSGFHHDNAPRHELMNIQQPASGSRLRSSPALLSGLRLRCWRAALSSYVRAAAAARRERREAVMASSAASSVRPPRPKKEPQALVIPKNAAEEQKLKLERLMKNPDKAVPIPEKMSEWAPRPPPEFVRDVMGSSAGAGSGEFHVYRHLRRREYQRQDYMDAMAEKQKLDAEFQKRLERNKTAAEEQTAKRRKKRQKLKEKKLLAKKMKLEQKKQKEGSSQSQEQPSNSSEEASGTEEEEQPSFITGR